MERKKYYVFNDDWQCCGIVNDLLEWYLKDQGFRVFDSIEAVEKAYKEYCNLFIEYPEDGPPTDLAWENVPH